MMKYLKNSYVKTFILLLLNLTIIELIFRLISGFDILAISSLRIIAGLSIFSAVITFVLNFFNNLVKKIVTSVIVFGSAVYAAVQMGFYNFLGVYMSLQTSSQLGAVTDYISDFVKSFNNEYFLVFIPFILLFLFYIFVDKKINMKRNVKKLKALITSLITIIIFGTVYTILVISPRFQSKLQTISNKDLFLTASNPSVTIDQYGSFGYLLLDVKAIIIPVTIEDDFDIEVVAEVDINENTRVIDDTNWKELIGSEENVTLNSINKYLYSREIRDKNDYTGLFEDKNLIVIMMESANDILINEKYYPNFYKIMSEGWYWENNYSPRNACATMNNEFSGMTSLYTIYNTCTASKYKANIYENSLFNLFNNKDYVTFSAHDYTEAYYPRKKIHTNMGSGEYYGVQKLGIKYSNEYRNWADDDDFMASVLKIIDNKTSNSERFMTWLTTVSSHQPYSVDSNQGNKYYDMTKKTKYDNDIKRYMSKLKILDNALGVLLEGLEKRGILDDTVIVLYGDHYPYGISTKHLNKVLDYDTTKDLNAERVPFVIYNSTIEPHVYSEYTSYINILPTIANLFNLEYDPRYYVGDDLLSDNYQSITIFADGSWKNELAYYSASKNRIKYYSSNEYSDEEIKNINEMINNKLTFSTKIIKNNYFEYLYDNLEKIQNKKDELERQNNSICLNSEKDNY